MCACLLLGEVEVGGGGGGGGGGVNSLRAQVVFSSHKTVSMIGM